MLNGYIPGLRYNIKGSSVATSRAMPTVFYLSIMKLVSFGPSAFMYIYIMSLIIGNLVLQIELLVSISA